MAKRSQENRRKTAKNSAAVALGRRGGLKGGKARMAQLSAKERSAFARKGVEARMKKISPEKRSDLARKAVAARWAKRK